MACWQLQRFETVCLLILALLFVLDVMAAIGYRISAARLSAPTTCTGPFSLPRRECRPRMFFAAQFLHCRFKTT
jgi:hypothetical protein